ncbi:hypothetical protein BDZ91DRAFT_737792 [Kalaharituber pfeilii]|nr:hypothetical protein BDZ91DRAFT_737792 [Kalaharituber pfeilii]
MAPRDTTVDGLILDYLLHTCISALLTEWDYRQIVPVKVENRGSSYPLSGSSKRDSTAQLEAMKKADRSLLMVNSFLQTYQQLHPTGYYSLDRNVRFRLLLCRFVTLFLRRIDPISSFARKPQTTILRCRKQRSARLNKYLKRRGTTHVFPNDALYGQFILSSTLQHAIPGSKHIRYATQRFGPAPENEDRFDGEEEEEGPVIGHISHASFVPPNPTICGSARLADCLPLFMLVSAWSSSILLGAPASTLWMQVAGSLMAHAFIEDYLCHGIAPFQAFQECFAWGVMPLGGSDDEETIEEDTIEEVVINEMFGAEKGNVTKEWEEVKKVLMNELIPPEGSQLSLEQHLVGKVLQTEENDDDTVRTGSFRSFEKDMVEGLIMAMANALEKPVLAQLEEGKLAGLEVEEVKKVLERAGATRWTS